MNIIPTMINNFLLDAQNRKCEKVNLMRKFTGLGSFSKMLSPHQNHVPVTPFRLIPGPWCRGGRFSGNCSFLAAFCPFCRSHQLPVVNHQGGGVGQASPINERGDKLTTNLGNSGKKITGRRRRCHGGRWKSPQYDF